MNKSEINKILELYNSKDWSESSKFFDVKVDDKSDKKSKRNTWVQLEKIPEFTFVKSIIEEEVKQLDKSYYPTEFITLLVYDEGDFFAEHADGVSSTTVKTGGYLLNSEFTGGEFMLRGIDQKYKVGELFYFNRDELHSIQPVMSGRRFALHFGILKKTESLI